MILLVFLLLLTGTGHSFSGNGASASGTGPSIAVFVNRLEIHSRPQNPEKYLISITLSCILNGPGSFSQQEGPHKFSLSDPGSSWTIPIISENLYFPPPLACRADFGAEPQKANQREIRTWMVRLYTECPVPKTAASLRLKGNLVFHIAPRTYILPPVALTSKGKGYTTDVPIPSPPLSEDSIALNRYQQTAIFTSENPAKSSSFITLSMNYNPSIFQLIDLLILDEHNQPASVFPVRSFNNQKKGDEFLMSKQFQASSPKWNQWKVAFSYLIQEETRRTSVPVNLEISLSSNGNPPVPQENGLIIHRSSHTASETSHLPRSRENVKDNILFHLFHIDQRPYPPGGTSGSVPGFTSLGFNIESRNRMPFLTDSSHKGVFSLEGDNPGERISLESHISRRFGSPKGHIPLFLETRGMLPPSASGIWRLSGTLDLGIADHMYSVEIPLNSPWGEKIDLPLKHIPAGMLPEDATLAVMAQDPKKCSAAAPFTKRRLVVYSTLPPGHFGQMTVIMPDNSRLDSKEPNAAVPLRKGIPVVYDLVLDAEDEGAAATLTLYINPRSVQVPVDLRFGLGGIITEKKEKEKL